MNNWLKKYINWIFPSKESKKSRDETFTPFYYPGDGILLFKSIIVESKTRPNSLINDNEFYLVEYKGNKMWVMFKCPCKCNTIISLSLQKNHNPHWYLEKTDNGRPSLYPSIWQKVGCQSHFWVYDGYIYWCTTDLYQNHFE